MPTPSTFPAQEHAVRVAAGRQLGRYEVLLRFASGGMADLFLGRLRGVDGFEKLVALKVIHRHLTEDEQFVKMFIDEAHLAARILHPNIAQILELGREGETHFIAMEYVDGESLVGILKRARLPVRVGVRIVADAAAGLHAAHELCGPDGQSLRVVHRDVSPANIMVSYRGATKVLDFGVARALGGLHTTQNELKGKLSYMAPEQLREPEKVDRRSDVFALGIVLYELTTRQRLFSGTTQADHISQVLFGRIHPPSAWVGDYPPELEKIVMRALERDQKDRYQTVHDLQLELERYLARSGDPVLPLEVGRLMQEIFAKRIDKKNEILEAAAAAEDSAVRHVELGSEVSLSKAPDPISDASFVATLFRSRRRRILFGGVVGFALIGFVLLLTALMSSESSPEAPNPGAASQPSGARSTGEGSASASARQITIAIKVSPKEATIHYAGRAVPTPLLVEQAARPGLTTIRIAAPGYKERRLEVSLERGGTWDIVLERAGAGVSARGEKAATKSSKSSRKPRRKPRKGHRRGAKDDTLKDDDVMDSPYE